MRSMRLTLSINGTTGPKVAINPMNVIGARGAPLVSYTIIDVVSDGEYHVMETPDAVFHELDAALAETIMTENTDAESYSGIGQRMTEGFAHVVEAIGSHVDMLDEMVKRMDRVENVVADSAEPPTVPPETGSPWRGPGGDL